MKNNAIIKKWIFCLIPAFLAALMYILLPCFPGFTEKFITRGIFRIVSYPVERVMSVFPFSVTETVVILLPATVIILISVWTVKLFRHPDRRKQIAEKGFRFVSWVISLMLLVFMIMDGGNFYRYSLGELMEFPDRRYSANELYMVTADLAQKASEARIKVKEDENGCMTLSDSLSATLKKADDCYSELAREYPFFITGVTRVKSVLHSHLWSYTGTTGVYCPWLGESSVNTDIPPSELGHTAAHEIAHTMGFAKENECNFLAWLACIQSNSPDYIYSGYLSGFIYCSNALYGADRELWEKAYGYCSDGILRDLSQRNRYWKQFRGKVMDSSQKANDSFIKANRVKSGIISYDEMVELMLRYYDKNGSFK